MRKGDPIFVSPNEKIEFRIDSKEFAKKLQIEWPNATVRFNPYPNDPGWVVGEIPIGVETIHYALPPDSEGVFLLEFGDIESYAKIVTWFRKLVPDNYRLFLHEDELWDCELQSSNTEQELIDALKLYYEYD